jgi:hypothetical protein
MMTEKKSPSLSQAVEQALADVDGPIAVQELFTRALAIRPSKAKNPAASLRNHLRWDHVGKTLVFLDDKTILPMRLAMRGVRFRIPLSPQETSRRVLFVQPGFAYFLRADLDLQAVGLEDESGRALPVRPVTVQVKIKGPFGRQEVEHTAFDLRDWFRARRTRPADTILVTIVDWTAGVFRLEHEPVARRREAEIERQDQELADLLFAMLEATQNEMLYAHMAVPTAYARLSDPRGYPGSHWIDVLAHDPRMQYDGWAIRYGDWRSPWERVLYEEEPVPESSFSPGQGRQVYRFKAALWDRPGLWRAIEVRGEQTLAEFDAALRDAFDHDTFDHLSGFWKLIRRGQSRRFRQVNLGDVNPLGGGSGTGLRIAGLGLQPGGELKYVYDFGDWIEHRITLEAISEPEAKARYPRVVAQNKPRYQDCQSCLEQGRKSRATWICLECSNREQREVLICDKCDARYHQDHYTEKILY